MESRLRMNPEVRRNLEDIFLEQIIPKLEALGVRTHQDLALVDDADLVRWGLSTIERRRFFSHVRVTLGDTDADGTLALLPPSALTAPVAKKAAAGGSSSTRSRRPDTGTIGPACLDELLGRGSAEHQVPRLAERVLATTGPIDISELSVRLARAAPALAQGYDDQEWPQFVEACVRTYRRLQVEEGVLEGDRAVVSICSSVLFSASEEVVADTSCWLRVIQGVATPRQIAILACVCRASREVCDSAEVWTKLLRRWYPKSTLLNPDWVAQSDLEKRLEDALENDYAFAALTKRIQPDSPVDIGDLLAALPQQTTPKALMKFMSRYPETFKQSPDGLKFCVSRGMLDLEKCKDWKAVNPFRTPPLPRKTNEDPISSRAPVVPFGRPKELRAQEAQDAKALGQGGKAPQEEPTKHNICQRLDPKQAFRLYHTGLLTQRSDQSKRGKLEAWEYFTESNSKCVMAAGDLCNLSESRASAIRANDPAVVHELVAQTIEGLVYKVPFGFWNRRVRIISNALNGSQLRIGREQRKKMERKLLEFMEWVKKERGFGYFRCDTCGSRWKSGFSYEEIFQECLQCGSFTKPFRIHDLEGAAEREEREKDPMNLPHFPKKTYVNVLSRTPAVIVDVPTIDHTAGLAGRGVILPPRGQGQRSDTGSHHSDNRKRRKTGDGHVVMPRYSREVSATPARDVSATPRRRSPSPLRRRSPSPVPIPPPDPAASASTSSSAQAAPDERPAEANAPEQLRSAGTSSGDGAGAAGDGGAATVSTEAAVPRDPTLSYTPGGGGFFARRRAAQAAAATGGGDTGATASAGSANGAPQGEAAVPTATPADVPAGTAAEAPAQYVPGGGGFFARRRAAAAAAAGGAVDTPATGNGSSTGSASRARSRSRSRGAARAATSPAPAPAAAAAGDIEHIPVEAGAGPDATETAAPAFEQDVAAAAEAFGLSPEEAVAMGLVAPPAAEPEAAQTTEVPASIHPTHSGQEVPSSDGVTEALGLSDAEARAMGLIDEVFGGASDEALHDEQAASAGVAELSAPIPMAPDVAASAEALGLSPEEAAAMGLLPPVAQAQSAAPDPEVTAFAETFGLSAEEAAAMGLLAPAEAAPAAAVPAVGAPAVAAAAVAPAVAPAVVAPAVLPAAPPLVEAPSSMQLASSGMEVPAAVGAAEAFGLSEEEARAMGLLFEAPGQGVPVAVRLESHALSVAAQSNAQAAMDPQASVSAEALGFSQGEAATMGLLPPAEPAALPPVPDTARDTHAAGEAAPVAATQPPENPAAETCDIPPDKLLALKTLGLSIEDGVRMGIIPASALVKPAAAAAAGASGTTPMDVDVGQDAENGPPPDEIAESAPSASSGDALVDAITAVVSFVDGNSGAVQELTHQSSDVAYVLSDAVAWPLLRRLAAETLVLESAACLADDASWAAAWSSAPFRNASAVRYAADRGYLLPDPQEPTWRGALLEEAAADLMLARMAAGRGFTNLPALAGPPDAVARSAGTFSDNQAAANVVEKAEKLVDEVCGGLSSAMISPDATLAVRLAGAADAAAARPTQSICAGSDGPVLVGGWSLMQEMSVREIGNSLREEYTVRRQIMLRRLDVTLEAMSVGKAVMSATEGQRRVADSLARMWSGWRQGMAEAPLLSEWNALSATRGALARSVNARVSALGTRVKSAVKMVRIGNVPDRGGVPESYSKNPSASPAGSSTDSASTPARAAAPRAASSGARPERSSIRMTSGPITGGSSSSSSGVPSVNAAELAGDVVMGDVVASDVFVGDAAASTAGSTGASSSGGQSSAVRSNLPQPPTIVPTVMSEDGWISAATTEPAQTAARLGPKPVEKKGTVVGARSTNKGHLQEVRARQKQPQQNYYELLARARGGR